MKPAKIILIIYLGLFLISLIFVWFAASQTVNSGMDRPQWEENLTATDYFLAWGGISLILNAFLCFITFGIYSLITMALRHRRRAFVNRA